MEFIRGKHNLRPHHQGCVATIGNFDGVHRGHQAILEQLRQHADRLGLPAVVVMFEPQPAEFFHPDQAPARLMSVRDKLEIFNVLGVDRVLCLRFNQAFCRLSAAEFCQQILIDGLAIRHLVIGDDFRFGHDRSGDFEFLRELGQQIGFSVESTRTYQWQGDRVSSTRVRAALEGADFGIAAQLLGRPYRIAGRVVHGDKIGRTIGVPTANLYPDRMRSPLQGVYAVTVDGVRSQPLEGIANIGFRPTVDGSRLRLEVHLFDFADNIYGQRVHISFHHKVRDERKFADLEALKTQIHSDIQAAQDYFGRVLSQSK